LYGEDDDFIDIDSIQAMYIYFRWFSQTVSIKSPFQR